MAAGGRLELRRRRVVRDGAAAREAADVVAVEEPLAIRVDGETIAVTMRTPGDDEALALGFLFAEGIIAGIDDVGSVARCGRPGERNAVDVRSAPASMLAPERVLDGRRWLTTSSACGVCGRREIETLVARCGRVERAGAVATSLVTACVARLGALQRAFARSGGTHAAAAFTADGVLLASHEDVGRHNAVDKTVGALLRRRLVAHGAAEPGPFVLAVSGRASFEIVQKTAVAGIPVVAAVSAPSSLAVDLADSVGITLAAFVRGDRFNVYTHPERLVPDGTRALAREA
jgi:FdhD protein